MKNLYFKIPPFSCLVDIFKIEGTPYTFCFIPKQLTIQGKDILAIIDKSIEKGTIDDKIIKILPYDKHMDSYIYNESMLPSNEKFISYDVLHYLNALKYRNFNNDPNYYIRLKSSNIRDIKNSCGALLSFGNKGYVLNIRILDDKGKHIANQEYIIGEDEVISLLEKEIIIDLEACRTRDKYGHLLHKTIENIDFYKRRKILTFENLQFIRNKIIPKKEYMIEDNYPNHSNPKSWKYCYLFKLTLSNKVKNEIIKDLYSGGVIYSYIVREFVGERLSNGSFGNEIKLKDGGFTSRIYITYKEKKGFYLSTGGKYISIDIDYVRYILNEIETAERYYVAYKNEGLINKLGYQTSDYYIEDKNFKAEWYKEI